MENFEDFKWGDKIITGVDIATKELSQDAIITFENGMSIPVSQITLAGRGASGKSEVFKRSLQQLIEEIQKGNVSIPKNEGDE